MVADCSNGGTHANVAGNGASYLIVAQLAVDQGSDAPVAYALSAYTASAGSSMASLAPAPSVVLVPPPPDLQTTLDLRLRAGERDASRPAQLSAIPSRTTSSVAAADVVPALGSVRTFQVLTDYTAPSDVWTPVTARLEYVGQDVLLYSDTRTPHAGFSAEALAEFGAYFDRILFPMDTATFGSPSDVDGNGRVIMLMSPAVNSGTPRTICLTQGYVAGFFNGRDFNAASDQHSNRGEIFYSMVADPEGAYGCVHSVAQVSGTEPAVFLHEMQHLISFVGHVVVGRGKPAASWMDEGLSLVAEELGSTYYEAKCPPPACRTSPTQLLPDSSLRFARTFMLDSYAFAADPDTVSLTLHTDHDLGTAWRGGAWALMRWLGDHMPPGFYKRLETTSGSGASAIETAVGGRNFASLFADFGLALYADSLPGMPRNTAPVFDRFSTRNTHQMWVNLLGTSAAQRLPFPISVHTVTTSGTSMRLHPGGMAFWRLDTPVDVAEETLRFSAPDGRPLAAGLHPQLAIFRLPPGQ
jgi:hypothetical protein